MNGTRSLRVAFVAAALIAASLHLRSADDTRPATRAVWLVRHAETAASTRTERDPSLSEAGLERAERLAKLLRKAGATHLFSSEYRRTRETLAPLAARTGLEVVAVEARDPAALLERLDALPPGSVAVVAGHSNTVPALATGLGVELDELGQHPTHGALLDHDTYDRLFLVVRPSAPDAEPTLVELRYGE